MEEDNLPLILKVKDVAELFRISLKQARSLPIPRIDGLGPKTIRYKRDDVLEFVQNNRSMEGSRRGEPQLPAYGRTTEAQNQETPMADRQVKQTRKDSDGDIIALCNSGALWSPRSKANAIRDIETGTHTYYVGTGANKVNVHVVNGPTGKYLRTDPDPKSKNNLDNLPDC